jgi:hypothetical protein
MTTENVAKIYLLITTLNATLYAIAELEPSKMTQTNKFRINNLRDAIKNYLALVSNRAKSNEIALINSYAFGNVAIIAELNCMIAYVPDNQIEWYIDECKKLVFLAVKKEHDEVESRDHQIA